MKFSRQHSLAPTDDPALVPAPGLGRTATRLILACAVPFMAAAVLAPQQAPPGETASAGSQPSALLPLPSGPSPQAGAAISSVKFLGLSVVDEGFVQSLIRAKSGDPFDAATLTEDIERLYRSGKFDEVDGNAIDDGGRAAITFSVLERPLITGVEITGNARFKSDELLKDAELSEGAPLSDYALKRAIDALERKYREKGYYYAKITVDEDSLRSQRRILLTVSEGPRVRIRKIEFQGATAFSQFWLRQKIESATYIWLLRTGDLDDERLQRDVSTLVTYYRDRAYLDVQVSYELDFAPNGADLTVRFIVQEGVRYAIRTMNFKGNTVLPADELGRDLKLKPGEFLVNEKVEADVKAARDAYWAGGYVDAEVRSEWVYAQEPGLVDLTLNVVEGGQYRMGRVIVRGNERTQDKVVRRELNFFPDDLYDRTATEKAVSRLRETRLFSDAKITPVGEEPAVRDALVEVTEMDTTQLLFGVGVTSNSGLVGNVSIENRNFDIFDWPRDFNEFFKGRSFRGAGQSLRLNLEPGTEVNRFRIDFREPYLLDQPVGYNLGAYFFERDYDEYDLQRVGITTGIDHRFREGLLRDWAVGAAFKVEGVELDDTNIFTAEEIRVDRGDHLLTSIRGSLVRNTADSLFLPTRGNRLTLAWEQFGALGGDYTFSKASADFSQFFTLYTDTLDRKHVLALTGTAGRIFGDSAVFERYYGGGIGSIRGFDFRGVSPRGGFNDRDRVGGEFQLLANAEYSFPLIGKTLRGVAFLDMGTVERDVEITTWRASLGLGARLYINFFGPVPLTFDFAWPMSSDDDDDTRVFSFALGTTF